MKGYTLEELQEISQLIYSHNNKTDYLPTPLRGSFDYDFYDFRFYSRHNALYLRPNNGKYYISYYCLRFVDNLSLLFIRGKLSLRDNDGRVLVSTANPPEIDLYDFNNSVNRIFEKLKRLIIFK